MNLALFDLDNTLLLGDSDYEWGQFLIAKGMQDREEHEVKNSEFLRQYNAGSLDIQTFLDFQLSPLAHISRSKLDELHSEFMRLRIRPMILKKGRDLVARHLASGDLVAVVTSTNSFVAGPIVRDLGIQSLIATVPAQVNGGFTGRARGTPSYREGKIVRVVEWLESMGLWLGSFEKSWFYGDSLNDIPLMERVTDPVAVDPDPTLAQCAAARAWSIISLRS